MIKGVVTMTDLRTECTDECGHYDGPPRWCDARGVYLESSGPGFNSSFPRGDFFSDRAVRAIQNWYSSGYPAKRLTLYAQRRDWSARCQYTVTG